MKAHFEKAQSKINRKLRVKNLCCNFCSVSKVHIGKRDSVASNTLINTEIEEIKSEVHLNHPVDTRKEEKVRIKSRNQVSRSRRVKKEVNQVDRNNQNCDCEGYQQ